MTDKFNKEARGVSPVIGVILMVAITVILAAVIGAFVLGIGGDQEQAPNSQLNVETEGDDTVVINHRGGDRIPAEELRISVSDDSGTYEGDNAALGVGESIEADVGDTNANQGNEVDVVIIHTPSDSIIREATVTIDEDVDDSEGNTFD